MERRRFLFSLGAAAAAFAMPWREPADASVWSVAPAPAPQGGADHELLGVYDVEGFEYRRNHHLWPAIQAGDRVTLERAADGHGLRVRWHDEPIGRIALSAASLPARRSLRGARLYGRLAPFEERITRWQRVELYAQRA